jgi:S1-C subfamily serine protease
VKPGVSPYSKKSERDEMNHFALYICTALILPFSAFASSSVSSDHVWAIVKISYDPATLKAEGGISGTVFFISDTTFLTAHHLIETNTSSLFRPNAGYHNVRIFLANSHGDIIDDISIVKRVPEFDLVIGRIGKPHSAVKVCPLEMNVNLGDEVYNIGFPTDQEISDYRLKIEGQRLIVQHIRMKPSIQQGVVKAIKSITLRANDVNLQDRMVLIMNYSSRIGFSGGPLVSKRSGKVVGLMSFVIPKEFDPSTPVVAIRMADIKTLVDHEGQPVISPERYRAR